MALDKEVREAVLKAVAELKQDEKIGDRFLLWLEALSEEELSAEDDRKHLESILEMMNIDETENSSGS